MKAKLLKKQVDKRLSTPTYLSPEKAKAIGRAAKQLKHGDVKAWVEWHKLCGGFHTPLWQSPSR